LQIYINDCRYTKFVWLFPTKSVSTDEVLIALKFLFAMFGYPQCIILDRGTAFSSAAFTNYMKDNEIKHIMTASQSISKVNPIKSK